MNYKPNTREVKTAIEEKLSRHFGCTPAEASRDQVYKAAALTIVIVIQILCSFRFGSLVCRNTYAILSTLEAEQARSEVIIPLLAKH